MGCALPARRRADDRPVDGPQHSRAPPVRPHRLRRRRHLLDRQPSARARRGRPRRESGHQAGECRIQERPSGDERRRSRAGVLHRRVSVHRGAPDSVAQADGQEVLLYLGPGWAVLSPAFVAVLLGVGAVLRRAAPNRPVRTRADRPRAIAVARDVAAGRLRRRDVPGVLPTGAVSNSRDRPDSHRLRGRAGGGTNPLSQEDPVRIDTPILVVIPTYNEHDNLPPLVRSVLAQADYGVLIVDDDSPDGTGEVADALAREFPNRVDVLHRKARRGLGRSYAAGFALALESHARVICQMDADLSHDPKYLPEMVAATSRYDVVIGSRYLRGVSVVNWPLRRIVLSAVANRYIRFVTRLRARDCTSGFRCWRREALARLPLEKIVSDGYAFIVEMLFAASRQGCRIGEVPIIFVERRQGVSKLSTSVLFESAMSPWRMRLRRRW
ncbi:MAG: glycosyltransferase [Acidobacteria bacterium]|nr:glycosyltransferase [Acidobacteriota bacterium]